MVCGIRPLKTFQLENAISIHLVAAMSSNAGNVLLHCQICVHSKECPPADFGADDLLQHIYAHMNYRPHKCIQCAFATSSPVELIQHSQQSMHYQLTLYNAENIFLKEICQDILEKCRRRDPLVPQQFKKSVDCADFSQSSSPIPSLNSSSIATQRSQQMETFAADGPKMAENFAMMDSSDSNCDNLPTVPKEQLQKAVTECILGVSEVFAVNSAHQSNDFGVLENTKTAVECASLEQRKCVLCGNISNSTVMREYHCNTHLNLSLFRCRICAAEFTKYNGWRRHMNDRHQRNTTKYERVEANWEELRTKVKAMFVPIGGPMDLLQCRQTPTSNSQQKRTAPTIGKQVKTEVIEHAEERRQSDGSGAKKMRTLTKVQCAECDEFLPDTELSRLNHTNVKHLNLCLYICPACGKEFTSTFNGLSCCLSHIKWHHPGEMLPYDEEMTMSDLPQKMAKIRARATQLFALNDH